jgi:hypothetical protein
MWTRRSSSGCPCQFDTASELVTGSGASSDIRQCRSVRHGAVPRQPARKAGGCRSPATAAADVTVPPGGLDWRMARPPLAGAACTKCFLHAA